MTLEVPNTACFAKVMREMDGTKHIVHEPCHQYMSRIIEVTLLKLHKHEQWTISRLLGNVYNSLSGRFTEPLPGNNSFRF